MAEISHIKTQMGTFSQHLASLWQKVDKVDTEFPHTTNDIQSLGEHINGLTQNFNDHVAWINSDMKSKEAARLEVLQDMSKERDRVIGQITSLTEQMNEIKTETDGAKAMDEKIRSVCSANTDPLFKRIEDLATSVLRLEKAQESLQLKNSESNSVTAGSRIPSARLATSAPSSGPTKAEIERGSERGDSDSAGTNTRHTRSQSGEKLRNHAGSRSAQKRKRLDSLFDEETSRSVTSGLSDSRSLTSTPLHEDASSKRSDTNHITRNSADHHSGKKKKKKTRATAGTLEAQPILLDSQ
jgi:uncharacterized protein YoxC